tara:strand:- start:21 stop:338 length:318 start_codon:yes stop_codon:yes gene_type:complete
MKGVSPSWQALQVTRVHAKAFVKEGVVFFLARILSRQGETVVREGVDKSVSAEYVELKLLGRISEVAKRQAIKWRSSPDSRILSFGRTIMPIRPIGPRPDLTPEN